MSHNNRYIKQERLKDFGPDAQLKLQQAAVLVVGLGGLGIPVLQYLNAMGIGTLGLVDQDVVELSNLQRQVIYNEDQIGMLKTEAAMASLRKQNSRTELKVYDTFLTRQNALEIISEFDVVVDATDNFATRYLINDACVIAKKPFIYGALHGFEGQVSVFNYQQGPTYRCLFPDPPSLQSIPDCNEHGVLGVIPGIIGNLQAMEVVKIISGIGKPLSGLLLLYDGLEQQTHKIKLEVNPANLSIKELQAVYAEHNCLNQYEIGAEDLSELIKNKSDIVLIDVRNPKEFQEVHIPGSKNIPLDVLEVRAGELEQIREGYLICQVGVRSSKAQRILEKILPKNRFFQVTGGLAQYLKSSEIV